MSYAVTVSKSVQKEIQSLPKSIQMKVGEAIFGLEINPRPTGCKKLSSTGEYRIRVGNYRIIYQVFDKEKIVDISGVLDRKEAY